MPVTVQELNGVDVMDKALEKKGITPDLLAEKLMCELGATEVKVFKDDDGVIYSEPMCAWVIRQRARMDAHKLMGHYPAEKHEGTIDVGPNMAEAVIAFKKLVNPPAEAVKPAKPKRIAKAKSAKSPKGQNWKAKVERAKRKHSD